MKLKMSAMHNLFAVLNRIDHDPNLKLKDSTRLTIAVNINRLLPDVQGYERARNRIYVDMKANGGIDDNVAAERDIALREQEFEIELKQLAWDDIKPMTDGQVITGLASLAPIIKDFDT